MANNWHLAQLNVAVSNYSADSAELKSFHDQIEDIQELAREHDGLVWLPTDEEFDTMPHYTSPLAGTYILENISVWKDADSLKDFVYKSAHRGVMTSEKPNFEALKESHMVLWWVPAGHKPDMAEGYARLNLLRNNGPGNKAFTFGSVFPMP